MKKLVAVFVAALCITAGTVGAAAEKAEAAPIGGCQFTVYAPQRIGSIVRGHGSIFPCTKPYYVRITVCLQKLIFQSSWRQENCATTPSFTLTSALTTLVADACQYTTVDRIWRTQGWAYLSYGGVMYQSNVLTSPTATMKCD